MTNEELNNALYEKMQSEQSAYRTWLLGQTPEEILNHTFEYTVRSDILMSLENNSLGDEQASALLKSESPLADVFKDYCKAETDHMEVIRDTLESRADREIQKEQERREALQSLPVYPYSAAFARENGELEQYRESYKANIACKEAIEAAIRDHYADNSLNTKAAVKQVAEIFGFPRMLHVLANTIKQKDWDGRFSTDNKRWAATQHVFEDKDGFNTDRNIYFIVDQAHPGLVDMLTRDARREFLLTLPLTVQEIRDEAKRLMDRLKVPEEPNSPNKTHFMAEISQDFLARVGSKDMTMLQKFFPFKSLTLTTMKDRKGIFAVIAGDENRDRKMREPRPSVLEKLKNAPAPTSPNNPAKSREPEL